MIPTWLLVSAAIVVVIASVVGLILLLRLWHVFFPKEASAPARAAAIASVLLLWSGTVRSVLTALYNFIHQLIVASQNPEQLSDLAYRRSVTEFLLAAIGSVPYLNFALALLALILMVRLFQAIEVGIIPKWLDPLREVREAVWINTLVLVIFFAGVYLIAASLCTIPALEVNQPFTEAERSQINSRIDAIASADAYNKVFPEVLPEAPDGASELRSLVQSATGEPIKRKSCSPSAAPTQTPVSGGPQNGPTQATPKEAASSGLQPDLVTNLLKADTQLVSVVKDVIQEYDNQYCRQIAGYQSLRSSIARTQQTEADNVRNQINSNLAVRLTGTERANYVYSLTTEYAELMNDLQSQLARCKSQTSDPGQNSTLSFLVNTLQIAASESKTNPHSLNVSALRTSLLNDDREESATSCSLAWINPARSRNAVPVPQLGVFSSLFGWLQNSDSLPLAIICGMLGVGLIGCILSSFVRQQLSSQPDDPWIPDPFPVVIRGFTAAIVVYLAIEGGLNVFSAQTNQANPYVLLFFCLVGAVFSEDVWVAARNRLQNAGVRPSGDDNMHHNSVEQGDKTKHENEHPFPKADHEKEKVRSENSEHEEEEGQNEVIASPGVLDVKESVNPAGDGGKDDKPASPEE